MNDALVPLNLTPVAPESPGPDRSPRRRRATADGGEKPVIFGVTVNEPTVVVVPPAFVTAIVPVRAAVGTVTLSRAFELTVKLAATPPTLTAVVPKNVNPVRLTDGAGRRRLSARTAR